MKKEMLEYNKSSIWLCLACVITNFSYYPVMISSGLGRMAAIAIWILLLVSLIFRGFSICGNIYCRLYLILYTVFCVNTAITGLVNDVNAFSNHFFQVVTISTLIFIVAMRYGQNFENNDLKRICIWYYVTTSIMSLPLFVFYLRNLNLSSDFYDFAFGKNEVAVMLLCSLIIGFVLYEPNNKLSRIFKIVSILFLLIDILYLRCRSSFLGVIFLFGTLSIYSSKMTQKLRISVLLFLLGVILYFLKNPESFDAFLNQIVYAGRDGSDISSLSSGRDVQIKRGIETFWDSPLFGVGARGTLDCFYVSVLANYGLLAWPLIVMAILPVIWGCINLKHRKKEDLCFFIIVVSMFFVSLCEEVAPFGPGVRCYFLWLMWGILLQINSRAGSVQIVTKMR